MLLEGIKCPACNTECKLSFTIADESKTDWVFCSCGSVFHQKLIDKSHFNERWLKEYSEWKAIKERFEYLERVYLPIIEELIYGRRFLDVGFALDYHIKNLKERGWISTGIDLIPNNYITGDFEDYKFKEKFDFILMGRVLESFHNPIKALYKAKELLNENGILMISTPDAELIYKIGMWKFGNWNWKEAWLLFGERQLNKILDTLDFKVVLSHKVLEQRFNGWYLMNIIAQKRGEQ